MADYVLAIDQGTTSSRAIVFDHSGSIVSTGQKEHEQIFPRAGWVEHNPTEIWDNVREVVGLALTRGNLTHRDLAAVGITNQRETTVVWDRTTGKPVYNAIVWQDTRTQRIVEQLGGDEGAEKYKKKVGLPRLPCSPLFGSYSYQSSAWPPFTARNTQYDFPSLMTRLETGRAVSPGYRGRSPVVRPPPGSARLCSC